MKQRVNLISPYYHAFIYTTAGADPAFPIVGELVRINGNGHVQPEPTKWSIEGKCHLIKSGNFSDDDFNFNPSEVFEDNIVYFPSVAKH